MDYLFYNWISECFREGLLPQEDIDRCFSNREYAKMNVKFFMEYAMEDLTNDFLNDLTAFQVTQQMKNNEN